VVRVGIPRALLYYQYYPMWKSFFERLGAEVIVSPSTSKIIASSGSAQMVAETCFPVKVFCGHVQAIRDKCDYLFIPAIRSVETEIYNCAKFLGLPDMMRAVIPQCPPIMEVEIDISKGQREFFQAIYALGRYLTWNPLRIKKAVELAWDQHLKYRNQMRCHNRPEELIDVINGEGQARPNRLDYVRSSDEISVAIIGHPYIVYDEYINHRLLSRLEGMDVRVLTSEMVAEECLEVALSKVMGRAYWTYEQEVVGAGGYYLEGRADGVIGVLAFGCGPDSLMMDLVHRHARRLKTTPFMTLTLDEHSAEAGLVTRLEAFVDMLRRKKKIRSV
jgi:predicted nucleotide-binding protein (sugar kinase/HSP70/actin superfamily)